MSITSLILGIISLIFGLYMLPQHLKGLHEFEINYKSIKGFILSIAGIVAGIYLTANELAKIV